MSINTRNKYAVYTRFPETEMIIPPPQYDWIYHRGDTTEEGWYWVVDLSKVGLLKSIIRQFNQGKNIRLFHKVFDKNSSYYG